MGRKIPLSNSDPSQAFHQTLGVPILLAGIAAVMAVVSLLCGVRLRRKSKSYEPADKNTNSPLISQPTATETPQQQQKQQLIEPVSDIESQINLQTAIKTPGKQIMRDKFSSRNLMKKSASTRVLAKNWSTKMQRSMSMAGRELQERMNNKGGKTKEEESVWMKTIILGERCRVEDGDDGIIYEAKGNRISAYHRKTSNSLYDLYAYRSNVAENRQPRGFSE